jgi:hypothetical protein
VASDVARAPLRCLVKPPVMPAMSAFILRFVPVLAASAAIAFSAAVTRAEDLTAGDLYGCWRRDAVQRIGLPKRKAWMDLCFRTDGSVYETVIAPEDDGEDLFKWKITTDGELVINRQACGVQITFWKGEPWLHLFTCVYMGVWRQLCTSMDETGFMCADKPGGSQEHGQ